MDKIYLSFEHVNVIKTTSTTCFDLQTRLTLNGNVWLAGEHKDSEQNSAAGGRSRGTSEHCGPAAERWSWCQHTGRRRRLCLSLRCHRVGPIPTVTSFYIFYFSFKIIFFFLSTEITRLVTTECPCDETIFLQFSGFCWSVEMFIAAGSIVRFQPVLSVLSVLHITHKQSQVMLKNVFDEVRNKQIANLNW